ncbi:uncharacterized protein LOC120617882 [Pteropus medius]|uniref:uncharacterized protein LOC120617882 n=1 Tax=Pteropus vampyrus TaxID=132908 RepID=UPI00196A7D9F|nr:uncharacterized protein LOC120617882 [Pteropus giganteus]
MRLCGYAREPRRRTCPRLTPFHTSLSLSFLIWEMEVKGNANLFPQTWSIPRSKYTHSLQICSFCRPARRQTQHRGRARRGRDDAGITPHYPGPGSRLLHRPFPPPGYASLRYPPASPLASFGSSRQCRLLSEGSPHNLTGRIRVRFSKPVGPSVLGQLETARPRVRALAWRWGRGGRQDAARSRLRSVPAQLPSLARPPPIPGWDPRPQPRPDSSASRAAAGGPWALVAAGSGRSGTLSGGCRGCGGSSSDVSQGSRVPLQAAPLCARSLGRPGTRALGSRIPAAGAAR